MFYDEDKAMLACEEDPSLIFEMIKEEHFETVDKLLSKHKININVCDESGNDILVRLLKKGQYDLVLKHMKNKDWDINHQKRQLMKKVVKKFKLSFTKRLSYTFRWANTPS